MMEAQISKTQIVSKIIKLCQHTGKFKNTATLSDVYNKQTGVLTVTQYASTAKKLPNFARKRPYGKQVQ
jgi:hypothetical protein